MSDSQIELSRPHVRGLRRVLAASNEFIGDVDAQLPDEDEETVIEVEDQHVEVVAHLLEAYQNVYVEDIPEDAEYADLDVIREIEDRITVD